MKYFILTLLLVSGIALQAQDVRLAQQYFQNGEYEKAAEIFKSLSESSNNDFYFQRYIESLTELEQYSTAERELKRRIKKFPKKVALYVTYGNLYDRQFEPEQAEKMYRKAIDKMPAEQYAIIQLANGFTNLTKYDLAIETYTKGSKLLKNETIFAYNLGNLYRSKGERTPMVRAYLASIQDNRGRMSSVQTVMQRYFDKNDLLEVQTQLYTRIQQEPENVVWPELLQWIFVQQQDYNSALRQARALDRRLNENGGRVYLLSQTAQRAKDYKTAIKGFDYIVASKEPTNPYYLEAKRAGLQARRTQLTEGYDYTKTDLQDLQRSYTTFLDEFGRSKVTAPIMIEQANLYALYLNQLDSATTVLEQVVTFPALNRQTLAHAKLALADYYLMQGEIWESTLLYSQVDKEFEDDALGHEARFRNARLSYFDGDFEWAQAQFDILKASTSKLIANDALDLSIFIMDNLALDTTTTPLQLYSEAELLVFQNRFDEAFLKLDTVQRLFPFHSLGDDIFYLKGRIYTKMQQYEKAVPMYQAIIDGDVKAIRHDNSLFLLAELYEKYLDKPDEAAKLYERILLEHSGSTFSVEARKRYRRLLGEEVQ